MENNPKNKTPVTGPYEQYPHPHEDEGTLSVVQPPDQEVDDGAHHQLKQLSAELQITKTENRRLADGNQKLRTLVNELEKPKHTPSEEETLYQWYRKMQN